MIFFISKGKMAVLGNAHSGFCISSHVLLVFPYKLDAESGMDPRKKCEFRQHGTGDRKIHSGFCIAF